MDKEQINRWRKELRRNTLSSKDKKIKELAMKRLAKYKCKQIMDEVEKIERSNKNG